jgi:hypothetical protein
LGKFINSYADVNEFALLPGEQFVQPSYNRWPTSLSNRGAFITINHLVALLLPARIESFFLIMELRKHALMSYRGRPNWPPRWVWLGGKQNERPRGEVGVLKEVSRYPHLSADGLTLVMEYNGSAYMGLLLFDDFAFSRKVHDLLKDLRGRPISEIGSLEVPS